MVKRYLQRAKTKVNGKCNVGDDEKNVALWLFCTLIFMP